MTQSHNSLQVSDFFFSSRALVGSLHVCPQDIKSEAELNSLLASAKPEALVVVKYYSRRCSSSKEIEPKYEETVIEFRDIAGPGSIHFAQVNMDDSRSLFERMGINSTPYLQVTLRFGAGRKSTLFRTLGPEGFQGFLSLHEFGTANLLFIQTL